jgi:DNA polymerase I
MNEKFAWLIDLDYLTWNGNVVVRLWCKDEEGVFIAYDDSFEPYFYVIGDVDESDLSLKIERKEGIISPKRIERAKMKIFGREREVFKVYARHPQHVPKLREVISQFAEVREADIPFVYRYLIDKDLASLDGVRIKGKELTGHGIRALKVLEIERDERESFPELSILAFDCEMLTEMGMPDPKRDPIIVIALKSGEYERIISGNDEREVIREFLEIVKNIDPDIIVGYNQDNFDWPYLKKRSSIHGIKLNLGRDASEVALKGRPKIAGRLNVDLYDIAMRTLDVKIKTLENIAEFLGRKIEIADIEAKDISKYWKKGDKEAVIRYSRQDVIHTYFIAEELLPMHYELSKMIRIPLDDVTRMGRGKQVDWLLLSEAYKLRELAPNPAEIAQPYEGAFVLEPERGLHENVVCLDFASMYPSIMISFNISPDTLSKEGCDCYVAPEVGHRFVKKPDGFFKQILKMLIERRKEIKGQMKAIDYSSPQYLMLNIKQETLKILTNSFYGYTGWGLARWYCKECAEATTAWGRHFIKTSAKIAESMGFQVLYGDTDSIFVKKEGLELDDLKREVGELLERLSAELPIQIEVDEYYKTIFFVEKKRYAGYAENGRIVIRGLEVRRGDWCELAKKVQRDVIDIILKEKNIDKAVNLVKGVIERIKTSKISLDDYIIYKSLTRRPSRYESVQAHVKAAMKAEKKGLQYAVGSKVGYIVTKGTGNVGDRAYPADLIESFDGEVIFDVEGNVYRLDKEYYINNQIIPSVMRILERFGYTDSFMAGKAEQKTLDTFF